jgi:hypothetical protein
LDGNGFWRLIGLVQGHVDPDSIERLIAALAELPTSEIESFDDRLHEVVHELDGPAWYEQPVNDPGVTELQLEAFLVELLAGEADDTLAVDGFLFARAAVVSAGRETYQQVLADPRTFAGDRDSRAQALLFVAQRAYERVASDHYDHVPPHDVGTGSNIALWGSRN